MTKRMLIDATHAEETRVVVLDGQRLEDFDVETSTKKQLKGNIYLARIVRVEPSLQAAFVEYGGGRHGFLAFGEIHPDYYQIPVADRQRLLALQAEEARAEAEDEDDAPPEPSQVAASMAEFVDTVPTGPDDAPLHAPALASEPMDGDEAPDHVHGEAAEPDDLDRPAQAAAIIRDERFGDVTHGESDEARVTEGLVAEDPASEGHARAGHAAAAEPSFELDEPDDVLADLGAEASHAEQAEAGDPIDFVGDAPEPEAPEPEAPEPELPDSEPYIDRDPAEADRFADLQAPIEATPPPETLGGETDSGAEEARRRRESRLLRNYRIQEVIRRRQVMLVQVVKEERGTKGAALTTYISLAGRFSVLMPNSPRGGGISRKITSAADRRRLKEVTAELDLPSGMGLIVRTAGANRPKPEIKRDCEYLMRLWDDIREHTLRSIAPALIYEEASLIKRAIRDVYSRDIDDIVVDGEAGWRAAHEFMRMLMPSHAKKVQLWRGEGGQPLFAKHAVEAQLDAMLSPTVQLKSGGYLVINPTEALVSIDVNSGRSTRERNIEETAFRTNLEAADEAARQLRLRDLAGLIVIDFIDMESRKNNASVERRLKEALRVDRARIQVGSISHFGLLEMSRQRLRPSVTETSFVVCPHCGGAGHVRSTESAAIHVLRGIEDEGARARSAVVMVHAHVSLVMYLLNHKRDRLGEIEARCGMRVQFAMDDSLVPPQHRIDRVRAKSADDRPLPPPPVAPAAPALDASEEDFPDLNTDDEPELVPLNASPPVAAATPPAAAAESEEGSRRRRRRRRRGSRRDGNEGAEGSAEAAGDGDEESEAAEDLVAASTDGALIDPAMAEQPEIENHGPLAEAESTEVAAGAELAAAAEVAASSGEPAEAEAEAEAADGDAAKSRRRGRRGGRRRRRDEPGEGTEAAEALPLETYRGPTPADPFGGGGLDIYDLLDTAALPTETRRPATARPAASVPPEPKVPEVAPVASPVVEQPVLALDSHLDLESVKEEAAAPVVEPTAVEMEPAPALLNGASHGEPAAPVEQAPDAPPQPLIGPAIQPVVIGGTEAGGDRKRGWWRR